ncbi:MAG: FAD-dependent oxidoreductase, partial [Caulobacteraceae bacterium]
LTNETVFDLESLPARLTVLGGGPIGVELGQAFRRLGSRVTVIDDHGLLGKEDAGAARVVADQLEADGVELLLGYKAIRAEAGPTLLVEGPAGERRVTGDCLLIAVGRKPGLEGLDLEAAGIAYDTSGVKTDRSLRTTNRRVFAVGDVAGRGQFTDLAAAHAGLFIRKALFALPTNADTLVVPRVTYADPELAQVGPTEAEARRIHGDGVRVIVIPFADNDRARTEGDCRGFGKLVATASGKILGVTLVGRHAGDQIGLWSLILSRRLKLSSLTGMIAPYPTRGEISKGMAGQWFAPKLFSPATRRLVAILKHLG